MKKMTKEQWEMIADSLTEDEYKYLYYREDLITSSQGAPFFKTYIVEVTGIAFTEDKTQATVECKIRGAYVSPLQSEFTTIYEKVYAHALYRERSESGKFMKYDDGWRISK